MLGQTRLNDCASQIQAKDIKSLDLFICTNQSCQQIPLLFLNLKLKYPKFSFHSKHAKYSSQETEKYISF